MNKNVLFLNKILKGFLRAKIKIRREDCKGQRGFFFNHPSDEGLDPFSLPFTEGFRSLNGGNQVLGGKWEGRMPFCTLLAQALRKTFLLSFELYFWLTRVTTWFFFA